MDFTMSFEQQALIDSLRRFIEKELYPHEESRRGARAVPADLARRSSARRWPRASTP